MMAGPPVSIGCAVMVTPGAAGPPDSGVIVAIPQGTVLAGGLPVAVAGSLCSMVNSVSGVPYTLPIGSVGASTNVTVQGQPLVRMGDNIVSGSGILMVLGPPASPTVVDSSAP
jgi:uncharacterized Zn-binding protein involved in type VI secretion